VSLREIAEEKVDPKELYNALVASYQRHVERDEPEEDDLATRMRRELAAIAAGEQNAG